MRTCRDAVLDAFARLEWRHGRKTFRLDEVVGETLAYDPQYKESTVRTHVTSRMCAMLPTITPPFTATSPDSTGACTVDAEGNGA